MGRGQEEMKLGLWPVEEQTWRGRWRGGKGGNHRGGDAPDIFAALHL